MATATKSLQRRTEQLRELVTKSEQNCSQICAAWHMGRS